MDEKDKITKRQYTFAYKVLDSKYFNCPQSRQRVFMVCSKLSTYEFKYNQLPIVPVSTIIDFEEKNFLIHEDKYYLEKCKSNKGMMSHKLINKKTKKGGRQGERVYSIDTCGPTICASSGGPGGKTGLYFINGNIRRLNIVESLQMFGFDKTFKTTIQNNEKILFHIGNSIVVNVAVSIIKNLHE